MTYTGAEPRAGRTVAADPDIIPLGSEMKWEAVSTLCGGYREKIKETGWIFSLIPTMRLLCAEGGRSLFTFLNSDGLAEGGSVASRRFLRDW
ncbi:MAG: hypothetical protein ACLR0U_17055 [Enterocloster clostridioformis]